MMQPNTGKSPTHRAYAVTQGKNKKSFWREIGAAWAHEDGKGFSLKLDFIPSLKPTSSSASRFPPKPKPRGGLTPKRSASPPPDRLRRGFFFACTRATARRGQFLMSAG